MTASPHILRRGRRYSFRCRVPKALAFRLGRPEVVHALGTANTKLARCLAAGISFQLNVLWATFEVDVPAAALQRRMREWFAGEVDRQWRLLNGGFGVALAPGDASPGDELLFGREVFGADAARTLERLGEAFASGHYSPATETARALVVGLGPEVAEGSRGFEILRKRIMAAKGEIEDARQRWADGEVEHSAALPCEPGPRPEPRLRPAPRRPPPRRPEAGPLQVTLNPLIRE